MRMLKCVSTACSVCGNDDSLCLANDTAGVAGRLGRRTDWSLWGVFRVMDLRREMKGEKAGVLCP